MNILILTLQGSYFVFNYLCFCIKYFLSFLLVFFYVQIKPPPDTITSIFKGFLARTTKICSEKYLRAEIQYLTDIFCENGHDRKTLQKIINDFEKKGHSTNNNNNDNTSKKQTITFPWIPKIGPKIKKEIKKLDLE